MIEPCDAGATQAQSEGMGPGDTSEGQRQNSVCNQRGSGQLPAPRTLECSDGVVRGECATTIIKKDQSADAAHEEEELEQEVRRQK